MNTSIQKQEFPVKPDSNFFLVTTYSLFLTAILHLIARGERATQAISFGLFMVAFGLLLRHPESLVAAVNTLPYLGAFSYKGVTALIGLLGLMAMAFCLRLVSRPRLLANPSIILLLIFFGYLLTNWYMSGPAEGLGSIKFFFIRGIVPAAVILTFGNEPERLRGFLVSTVAFAFLSSIMVVGAFLGKSQMTTALWGNSGRISVFGWDPISFAIPIGLGCVVLLHFCLSSRSSLLKVILFPLFGFMFFSIFPTGSRQIILALSAGIITYAAIAYKHFLAKSFAGVTVTLAVLIGFFLVINNYDNARFNVTSKGYLNNTSFKGRLVTMQRGLDTFIGSPVFGVGAGGHGKFLYKVDPTTGKSYKEKEHIHNLFIELLAEQGIVGFSLFLLPVALAFWNLLSAVRKQPNDFTFRANAAVMFALLAYSVMQANISGGISVSGGLIAALTAWASVLAKGKVPLREPADGELPIPEANF